MSDKPTLLERDFLNFESLKHTLKKNMINLVRDNLCLLVLLYIWGSRIVCFFSSSHNVSPTVALNGNGEPYMKIHCSKLRLTIVVSPTSCKSSIAFLPLICYEYSCSPSFSWEVIRITRSKTSSLCTVGLNVILERIQIDSNKGTKLELEKTDRLKKYIEN